MLVQSHFKTYNAKVFNLGTKMTYKYTLNNIFIYVWNKFISKSDFSWNSILFS